MVEILFVCLMLNATALVVCKMSAGRLQQPCPSAQHYPPLYKHVAALPEHVTHLQQVQAVSADAADAVCQLVLRPVREARLIVGQVTDPRPDVFSRRLQRPEG